MRNADAQKLAGNVRVCARALLGRDPATAGDSRARERSRDAREIAERDLAGA
ncbi:MAG: hypothetical protein AVDCRST_MAG53-3347 [uncultured Solirubrobacteraceae bacterium]|uniref:Uncharacterized protein n=1 Tax=uncultured Solirubrobacteraceae bacterium TaxID=1162706 RepID=A0A6J4TAT3_9ACTN|nr:MAG: hypothetical protein AVDCRST_MAG53-3347 [uncultured Solirubrobacteraceae bacterium]